MSGQTEHRRAPGPELPAETPGTAQLPGTALPTDSPAEPNVSRGTEVSAPEPRQPRTPVSGNPVIRPAGAGTAPRPVADPADPAEPEAAADVGAGVLLGGRYRLVRTVGADPRAGAEFWQAEDTVLRRDVAVTVLRPTTAADTDERAAEMVTRALRTGGFSHRGCARLLDVLATGTSAPSLPPSVLGAAVTEWVPGRSLVEVITGGLLKPLTAARMTEPLAAAAEAAHRHGLVLGCAHPQRIRVTPDGRAQLAFALPGPETGPADDVRGLAAVLYALLTTRWPLPGLAATAAGMPSAPATADGGVAPPGELRPGVPPELDRLTTGALEPRSATHRVSTAAAVHRVLREVTAEHDTAAVLPPVPDGVPSAPGDIWQEDPSPRPPDPRRRRNMAIALCALGAAVLVVLGYVGVQVGALFGDGPAPTIVVAGGSGADGAAGESPSAGGTVGVAGVEIHTEGGDPDNPGRVSRVIDGDPDTSWRTFSYRQQFPALKPGVGLMVSFVSAEQLVDLKVTSPSAGTRIEVRAAPSADSDVSETTLVTTTDLRDGPTEVSLAQSQPVQHVLLWITRLGGGGDQNVTQIDEVVFTRAGS